MSQLVPPDLERCQAEIPRGNAFSFGPVKMVRCNHTPVYIITEKKADSQGQKGSMSVCQGCLQQAYKQMPNKINHALIKKPTNKIKCSCGADLLNSRSLLGMKKSPGADDVFLITCSKKKCGTSSYLTLLDGEYSKSTTEDIKRSLG